MAITQPKYSPMALLAVNTESRRYARTKYHLAFQNKLSNCPGDIYIDFERDTLFFKNFIAFDLLCTLHTRNMNMLQVVSGRRVLVRMLNLASFPTFADDVTVLPGNAAIGSWLSDDFIVAGTYYPAS